VSIPPELLPGPAPPGDSSDDISGPPQPEAGDSEETAAGTGTWDKRALRLYSRHEALLGMGSRAGMLVTFNLDSLTLMTRVTLGHRDWIERTPGGGPSHISPDVMPGMFRAQMTGLELVTSKPTGTARTNRAFVHAVAGFAALVAYRRGLHSRAVCIRGQSLRLWPFRSSVPWQLVHLCTGPANLKALLWVVLPHSLHPV
jgi:hypothetical protein